MRPELEPTLFHLVLMLIPKLSGYVHNLSGLVYEICGLCFSLLALLPIKGENS